MQKKLAIIFLLCLSFRVFALEHQGQHIPTITITEIINKTNKNLVLSSLDKNNNLQQIIDIPAGYQNNKLDLKIPVEMVFNEVTVDIDEVPQKTIFEIKNKDSLLIYDKNKPITNPIENALLDLSFNQTYHPSENKRMFTFYVNNTQAPEEFSLQEDDESYKSSYVIVTTKPDYAISLIFEGENLKDSQATIHSTTP